MTRDHELGRILNDLSDVPAPGNLADRALKRAKTQRRKRHALSGAAALLAVALISAPFFLSQLGISPSMLAAGPGTSSEPCGTATTEAGVEEVPEAKWPAFVRATIDRLPARSDYVMQSGSWCNSFAYAVINLGKNRERGHVTVELGSKPHAYVALKCADVQKSHSNPEAPPRPKPVQVLFCDEGTDLKIVYGIDESSDSYYGYSVYAVYADGRTVAMGSSDENVIPAISAEQLRAVATDPAMVAFIG